MATASRCCWLLVLGTNAWWWWGKMHNLYPYPTALRWRECDTYIYIPANCSRCTSCQSTSSQAFHFVRVGVGAATATADLSGKHAIICNTPLHYYYCTPSKPFRYSVFFLCYLQSGSPHLFPSPLHPLHSCELHHQCLVVPFTLRSHFLRMSSMSITKVSLHLFILM